MAATVHVDAARRLSVLLSSTLILVSCGGGPNVSSPTPLAYSPAMTGNAMTGNWRGDATVVSETTTRPACGPFGMSVGEIQTGIEYNVTINGASVLVDEDMRNWPTDDVPYSGTLNGRQFTATYSQGADYLKYACQFKGGTLSGAFSENFSSFEATETLVWGPAEQEARMERHMVVKQVR